MFFAGFANYGAVDRPYQLPHELVITDNCLRFEHGFSGKKRLAPSEADELRSKDTPL